MSAINSSASMTSSAQPVSQSTGRWAGKLEKKVVQEDKQLIERAGGVQQFLQLQENYHRASEAPKSLQNRVSDLAPESRSVREAREKLQANVRQATPPTA